MKKGLLVFGLLFLVGTVHSMVVLYLGNEILDRCEAALINSNSEKAGVCYGYIAGIVDAEASYQARNVKDANICLPKGTTNTELARLVVYELRKTPDKLHLEASRLVINILAEAFPCP
jgi:hypothetical protein